MLALENPFEGTANPPAEVVRAGKGCYCTLQSVAGKVIYSLFLFLSTAEKTFGFHRQIAKCQVRVRLQSQPMQRT